MRNTDCDGREPTKEELNELQEYIEQKIVIKTSTTEDKKLDEQFEEVQDKIHSYPMQFNAQNNEYAKEGKKLVKLSGLALELYQTLDDIDTYSDMLKSDYKKYQKFVMRRIQKFHDLKLTCSDGYNVYEILPADGTENDSV
jgi:hypothetical protein